MGFQSLSLSWTVKPLELDHQLSGCFHMDRSSHPAEAVTVADCKVDFGYLSDEYIRLHPLILKSYFTMQVAHA